MADIQALKTIYRRLAKQQAGNELAAQKTYLEARFAAAAENMDEGDAVAINIARLGSTSGWLYRGATAEERGLALHHAITEIDGEIDGLGSATKPAPLIMRFGEPPFNTLRSTL